MTQLENCHFYLEAAVGYIWWRQVYVSLYLHKVFDYHVPDENNKFTQENVRCTEKQTWLLSCPVLTTLSNKVK